MLIFASPKIVQTVFEQLGTKFHLTREMCFLGMNLDNNNKSEFDAKKVAEQKSESDEDSSESFEGSEEEY